MNDTKPIEIADDTPYVNALVVQMIKGIEEIMGTNGLKAVLHASGLERFIDNLPPSNLEKDVLVREYAQLNEAVEQFTGRAGKGMLQRIGRASFRYAIKEQAAVMGLAGIALKAFPHRIRKRAILLGMRKGLMDVVEFGRIDVEEEGDALVYTDHTCTICHMRHSDKSICYLYLGSLGEAMAYATGKDFRDFEVVETHCRAKGDSFCRFEIRDRV